ncbi:hypothetical protein HMPREF3213_03673 [Heyndrickxia coagulans]|uniref:Uncharacterized protein n=1 Tax=Heyndrickxia coagulans TaxID=1398 RepID=A0A133KBE5_HEYCO|nr:hypothetical protein HMPREF3213_03673 [Heyndrickxia coagulans]
MRIVSPERIRHPWHSGTPEKSCHAVCVKIFLEGADEEKKWEDTLLSKCTP